MPTAPRHALAAPVAAPRAASAITAAALLILLAWLAPPAHAQPAAEPVVDATNVVILLDASGSMGNSMRGSTQSKMIVARQALLSVVQSLPPDTNVGVLVFSGRGKQGDWVHDLGPIDLPALERSLNALHPDGGTPLGRYIQLAANRLLNQRAEQGGYGTYRLIIVTDGQAGDEELVEAYTPQVLARGLTVQVIGVAMNEEHMLANRVHAYRPAADAASLQAALSAAVAEVRTDDTGFADADGEFDVIAPLPAESALPLIAALRISGNDPIPSAAHSDSPNATANTPANPATSTPASPAAPATAPVTGFGS
ncbi:MAG: vWA domain-containing protein, partial [Planctomycetota bacterium]